MNIETAIILVPGHAFLAWKSKPGPNSRFDKFLETTLAFNINNRVPYESAALSGGQQYEKHNRAKQIERVIDIREMWKSGVTLNEVP